MNKQNIQTLKGFRDFLPEEKRKRDYVEEKIKRVFEKFGFEPLETPTLEYASLLLGKYGNEADKLVYKFQDRGNREVALRYDQTVPTARILVQYQNELAKYFRRYQMQNVFRADKPQKGRFREFAQCDIDIFGAKEGIADAEILACTYSVFMELGFEKIKLNLNDRKVLVDNLTEFEKGKISVSSIIASLDKLDKISENDVILELTQKGLGNKEAMQILEKLRRVEIPENLVLIMEKANSLGIPKANLVFNPFLARGLDYYTAMIFEVKVDSYESGSLGGGGRYDNLIESLCGLRVPAVGVGLGFDRIVEVADSLNLIKIRGQQTDILVTVFEGFVDKSLEAAKLMREMGFKVEVYPQVDKLGKQFKLANDKKIKYVAILGEEEIRGNFVTIKNMEIGEQKGMSWEEVEKMRKA